MASVSGLRGWDMMRLTWLCLVQFLCVCSALNAIVIDGQMDDWASVETIYEDSDAEHPSTGDLVEIRVSNDAYNLYVFFAFASPVNLAQTGLQFSIDADGDPGTGIPDSGRGMDFSWDIPGNRGTSTLTSRSDIGRGNLVERIAPSGSSAVYEMALSLEALPAVAAGMPVHLVLIENNSGDRLPDAGAVVSYLVKGPVAVQPLPIAARRDPGLLRVVSWNVLRDAPFSGGNEDAFTRILKALQPDIFLLQEVYDTPTSEVLSYFEDNLQIRAGDRWEAKRQQDCITVSRYPILESWSSDGNLVTRHETERLIGRNLLVGNAHFPCCDNESGRIRESLRLLEVIEAHLDDDGVHQAVLVGGDLNSGGLAPELVNLTTGQVPLEMASPRHLYQYDQYTWGSLGSYYGSSRLDFLLFDPIKLFRHKAFILDTDMVPADALSELGLEAGDTFISDHLPLVLDLCSPNLPEGLEAAPMAVDGSTTSDWFGELNGWRYPDIRHESFGWIRMYEEGSGYWIKPESGPWLWTGPEAYPWAYIPNFGNP